MEQNNKRKRGDEPSGPNKKPTPPFGSNDTNGDGNSNRSGAGAVNGDGAASGAGIATANGSDNANGQTAGAAGGSQAPKKQTTWKKILDEGMERHRRSKKNADPSKDRNLQIDKFFNMQYEWVVVAIASVWAALGNDNHQFAFSSHRFFESEVKTLVNASAERFILPLLIPHSEDAADNMIAHIVLATADMKKGEDNTFQVALTIRDSLPDYIVEPDRFYQTAQDLIEGSQWPFNQTDNSGQISNLIFTKATAPKIPYQAKGRNECGFHTIINAWAIMLGIPIYDSPDGKRRAMVTFTAQFPNLGLEIVNLVLRGHMDTRTIQAFLHYYGYAAEQDCNTEGVLVNNVKTIPFSGDSFHQLVRELARGQQLAKGPYKSFPEDIQAVYDLPELKKEFTATEVGNFLQMCNDDIEQAIAIAEDTLVARKIANSLPAETATTAQTEDEKPIENPISPTDSTGEVS